MESVLLFNQFLSAVLAVALFDHLVRPSYEVVVSNASEPGKAAIVMRAFRLSAITLLVFILLAIVLYPVYVSDHQYYAGPMMISLIAGILVVVYMTWVYRRYFKELAEKDAAAQLQ